jgi:organic radical activating enzyme
MNSISNKIDLLDAKIDHAHTCLDRIWHEVFDVKRMLVEQKQAMVRTTPRNNLRVAFPLATDCNLNCAGCGTFSPCASKLPGGGDRLDIEQFRMDINRLSELFDDKEIRAITLAGGEPLLNPKVSEFPYEIRKVFPSANVRIITNGILLLEQSEAFWKSMQDNDVTIEHTKYPIKLDYEKIENTVKAYGLRYFYANNGEVEKSFWRFPIVLNSKARETNWLEYDSRANFISCGIANECITLLDGKLYTCSRIPLVKSFNTFFKADVPVSKYDGIDIYQAKSRDEIYKFLASPAPFCAYCRPDRVTEGHPFRISNLDISEWADEQ